MVRRGSTVRVRQRASINACKSSSLVVSTLNTRTHFGHIDGTDDARRRFATPSGTTSRARQDRVDCRSSLQRGSARCPSWREPDPLSLRRRGRQRLLNGARFLAEPQDLAEPLSLPSRAETVPSRLRFRPMSLLRLGQRYGRLSTRHPRGEGPTGSDAARPSRCTARTRAGHKG
jgi:hypothetical protein